MTWMPLVLHPAPVGWRGRAKLESHAKNEQRLSARQADIFSPNATQSFVESVVERVPYESERLHTVTTCGRKMSVPAEEADSMRAVSTGEANDTAAPADHETSPPPQPNATAVLFTPELLQIYYARLFPFELLYQWMSYGKKSTFNHREFSFTLDKNGEEIYIRYQSFSDQADLAQAIHKRRPVKIDIGAVYSHPPSDKNAAGTKFIPEARELVFDIDLTDYDDIRKCGCSGANICNVCWKYMRMAIDVVDETLRDDFGYQHVAWFYSGRRGVHCWVCDATARELTDQARGAVANYIGVRPPFYCMFTAQRLFGHT
jgi:hypothetical protein